MANPPPPGSILVKDQSETWEVINPQLNSEDASQDGLGLKKIIAIGAGIPTHYLAEPESSTRTTAEAAGTPTFRGLEQTQTSFTRMLTRLVKIAVRIRKAAAPQDHLNVDGIEVVGPDITERDNAILALAVARIYPVLSDLFDREGINEAELLRLTYRMAGETFDEDASAPKMQKKPLTTSPAALQTPGEKPPADPDKSPKGPDEIGPE
jgi:hypothetical protein